jgi:ribosomal protein L7/L12
MKNVLVAIIGFVALGLFIAFAQKRQRDERARMQGLLPAPGQIVTDDDVKRLAQAGEKITAIKFYRRIHGGGLKEAKDAVEAMASGQGGLRG